MPDTLRIDKWLFFTRFFKTRGQATSAVTGGHVERNGERAKPATPVAPGDKLVITKDRYTFEIDVISTPTRRGPAPEARACYAETEESIVARQALSASIKAARMTQPLTEGRPDKHTRRQLRDWKDKRG
ncbi:MAG: RNA-binding S4 domain-containing protein [Pseudomonadota bacterium]